MAEGGPYRTGKKFGPYTLESYLGSGAFKTVYKAGNRGTLTDAEFVALGFPHQQDEEGIAELREEFIASARLIHPNIVRIYGVDEQNGVSFLVMEYLEGQMLRARLRQEG